MRILSKIFCIAICCLAIVSCTEKPSVFQVPLSGSAKDFTNQLKEKFPLSKITMSEEDGWREYFLSNVDTEVVGLNISDISVFAYEGSDEIIACSLNSNLKISSHDKFSKILARLDNAYTEKYGPGQVEEQEEEYYTLITHTYTCGEYEIIFECIMTEMLFIPTYAIDIVYCTPGNKHIMQSISNDTFVKDIQTDNI